MMIAVAFMLLLISHDISTTFACICCTIDIIAELVPL